MTSMVVTQPRPLPVSIEIDDWATGICSCCDDKAGCCFAFWCCPCFACRTTREYGQCLCLPLLDIFGCIPAATMSMRISMRQRYGIKGSMCTDCVCAFFCLSCVWCQMSREMKKRELPIMLGDIIHR